jgi:Protein of unknown function (DUF4232)
MIKALAFAIVIAAFLAGCDNGPKEAGPVPTGKPSPSTSTSTGQAGESTTTTAAATPLCKDKTAVVKVDSHSGAAGTIMTTWRVTNTSSETCRSFGYPGMDFHAASGWLDVQVHRGGIDMISQSPAPVVLEPGKSLYFVSFWGDVDTDGGPCTQFDRVKVTLPDNFTPARVDSSGCVDPGLVNVGPVTSSPPA